MYVCTYVCMYAYSYICMYHWLYVSRVISVKYIRTYKCMQVFYFVFCMHTCIHPIHMYVCTYVCSHSFPDVMMESYNRHQLSPLFFIVFLIFGLYIIANVLLAVVYSTFQKIHKEKFRKLFLHRR